MNNFFKKVIVILSISVLTSSVVLAEVNFEKVDAYLKNTNIEIHNTSKVAPTLYYNKDTYIPLQFVGETLDCSIDFDKKNNILTLKNNQSFKSFAPLNPWAGENFIYGEILKIDKDKKIITIEQHFDDNSISIDPNIKVSTAVIIIYQRNDKKMNLDFEDLKIGDIIGSVLTKEGIARGMILTD